MQTNLELGLQRRDHGISRVSVKNGTFLETMRGVARLICTRTGKVTVDDLRKWARVEVEEMNKLIAAGLTAMMSLFMRMPQENEPKAQDIRDLRVRFELCRDGKSRVVRRGRDYTAHHPTSKYMPHQGKREKARRVAV